MLADAESGKFSHLGLYRADRFGRNTIEGLQAATKLISLGVKIRVAYMPSLRPEEPDGFFMFLLQMGLAQREVDVLAQRTADGMEAKLRDGGWPAKAPEGYINKERLVSSNKYDRWVEIDSIASKPLKEAWELLLTNRYTLDEICEELTRRGYTRSTGRPWAWTDPKSGSRITSRNRLHAIFHNPFYAGWTVSERFNITIGEIRGKWEPLVTLDQFDRGVKILLKNGNNKSRFKRQAYLLRNLLWVREGDRECKMYGSTPTGRTLSYSYYITNVKLREQILHVPTNDVDEQIPNMLAGIAVDPELIPSIREIYQNQIKRITQDDKAEMLIQLKQKLSSLKEEEARLARLYISGKMSEQIYDQLRMEWQEKSINAHIKIKELEFDTSRFLDDLEVALVLMTELSTLFDRLEDNQKHILLKTIAKRIIIDPQGEIISCELNSPFAYLFALTSNYLSISEEECGSEQVRLGALKITSQNSVDLEEFLAGLRFEQKSKIEELSISLDSSM